MTLIALAFVAFILVVAVSIVWSTLKTGISPMMSSGKACHAMLAFIEKEGKGAFIDLGSGWGTLVIKIARNYPNQKVIGYELSWFPWMVSMLIKFSLGLDNLSLYRQDFRKADLSNTAVLFCYLFPQGMADLEKQCQRDLTNNTLIVSNTFAFPHCQPIDVMTLNDLYQTPIYRYRWQAK